MNTTCANYPSAPARGPTVPFFLFLFTRSLRASTSSPSRSFTSRLSPRIADPAQRSTTLRPRVFRETPRISADLPAIAWHCLVRTFQRCSVSECVITVLLRFYCGANVKSPASAEYVTIVAYRMAAGEAGTICGIFRSRCKNERSGSKIYAGR